MVLLRLLFFFFCFCNLGVKIETISIIGVARISLTRFYSKTDWPSTNLYSSQPDCFPKSGWSSKAIYFSELGWSSLTMGYSKKGFVNASLLNVEGGSEIFTLKLFCNLWKTKALYIYILLVPMITLPKFIFISGSYA